MDTADVIVIGAGVNGASTAFHLARAGVKRVVVIERGFLAAGATGKSGALVRTNYGNEPETRLALESLNYFKHWDDIVGGDCGYQPRGLLFFSGPEYQQDLEKNLRLHRELGINTRIITPAEAKELDPSLNVEDVTEIGYEPESGYADPNATTYGFVRAARTLGVEFRLETSVTRVLVEGERVKGVETTKGILEAPVVILAAGAWANQLLTPLGIDLGLEPRRARVVVFRWAYDRSPQHLTYLDRINQMWARPIDNNCTLVGVDTEELLPGDPNAYAEGVEQQYINLCREQLAKRFPAMRYSALRGGWACMLMFSQDRHPLIGALPPYEGLYGMLGDSGTSFKTGPAIGRCLAELVTEGRATTVDLTPFRPTRFAEGKLWVDDFGYGLPGPTISR
jgi:sarcosine oxidase subunit beta